VAAELARSVAAELARSWWRPRGGRGSVVVEPARSVVVEPAPSVVAVPVRSAVAEPARSAVVGCAARRWQWLAEVASGMAARWHACPAEVLPHGLESWWR